jgi:endonuclease-3
VDGNAKEIYEYLRSLFGENPKCELEFSTDIECLVAVILSAQCTDRRVNVVTRELFKKYKTVGDYARADVGVLEREIYSTGFYRNKAKAIVNLCRTIESKFGGVIPREREILTTLAGVGRKTAGVYLVCRCGGAAFPVDTHVTRVSHRLGLSSATNPDQIERDLCAIFDRSLWGEMHYLFVLFGRYHCTARNPKCAGCGLKKVCEHCGG